MQHDMTCVLLSKFLALTFENYCFQTRKNQLVFISLIFSQLLPTTFNKNSIDACIIKLSIIYFIPDMHIRA